LPPTVRSADTQPNKRMQLTKLRAAPVLQAEVPPCAPAGWMDGGTASQLIRSVGTGQWGGGGGAHGLACSHLEIIGLRVRVRTARAVDTALVPDQVPLPRGPPLQLMCIASAVSEAASLFSEADDT
jgi:hypothetical protein